MWETIKHLPSEWVVIIIIVMLVLNKGSDFLKILTKSKEGAIETISEKSIEIYTKLLTINNRLTEIDNDLSAINLSVRENNIRPVTCPLDRHGIINDVKHLREQHDTFSEGTPIWYFPSDLKKNIDSILYILKKTFNGDK